MKKHSKIIHRLLTLCIIVFSLCGINKMLCYLLINDIGSYTRITLHEMYTQQDNIDILFLGSSHCYRSLDTEITDKIFGKNTFNAGTSSQSLDGSYALLVEAGKTNDLKQVYLEMYYGTIGEEYEDRTLLTQTYAISDYMKPSLNRTRYIMEAGAPEHWINGFFLARRNWQKLFDVEYMKELADIKQNNESYRNYEYIDNGNEMYAGKGFVYNKESIDITLNYANRRYVPVKENLLSKDDIKSLNRIIQYCKKNEIALTVFCTPMPDFELISVANYDSYINQLREIFKNKKVEYYDFNLCNYEKLKWDDDCFWDTHHLNGKGAGKFSTVFAKLFTGKIEYNTVFYDSIKEKISKNPKEVYGYNIYTSKENNMRYIEISPVLKENRQLYYSAFLKDSETEDITVLQAGEKNNIYQVPTDFRGELVVYVFEDADCEKQLREIFYYFE